MLDQPLRDSGNFTRPLLNVITALEVNDHGMVGRTVLRAKDPAHRLCVPRIGAEPVHGFGGKRHQPAGLQDPRSALDRSRIFQTLTSR
jgi:hypothetical protein